MQPTPQPSIDRTADYLTRLQSNYRFDTLTVSTVPAAPYTQLVPFSAKRVGLTISPFPIGTCKGLVIRVNGIFLFVATNADTFYNVNWVFAPHMPQNEFGIIDAPGFTYNILTITKI